MRKIEKCNIFYPRRILLLSFHKQYDILPNTAKRSKTKPMALRHIYAKKYSFKVNF